jgi:omega-6 fatty acid desaturase (delta-12 desaturase)
MIETSRAAHDARRNEVRAWQAIVAKHQRSHTWRAVWQLVNTFGSYFALWYLLYVSLSISWWLTVPLAIVAGGVLIRAFIIFHDCGHDSFFASKRANQVVGFVAGLLAAAPYRHWSWQHAVHHATSGDLDRRGVGDIWTLTVQEYLAASRWKRLAYRLSRNPFVLFVLAPFFLVLVMHRFSSATAGPRERRSVWITNGLLAAMVTGMCLVFGVVPYLIIQAIIIAVAASAGVWLFYVQHQFDETYWERGEQWEYTAAALRGSSFYKLPRILQWFSGNIGFHHVHHLSPRIPNYNLERCHDSDPLFQEIRPLTVRSSFKSFGRHLWDEAARELVSFRMMRERQRQRQRESASRSVEKRSAVG